MIRCEDDGGELRPRQQQAEATDERIARREEDGAADDRRPAKVEAGHGRVGIDEGARRLRLVAEVAVLLDGADELAGGEQARRHDGEPVVDDEADRPGEQESIAGDGVFVALEEVQPEAEDDDEREVEPEVDEVEELDERVAVDDDVLQPRLPVDAQPALEIDDMMGVRERFARALDDERAHGEVEQERQSDERKFEGIAEGAVPARRREQALRERCILRANRCGFSHRAADRNVSIRESADRDAE